jgi:hypothetical protein
LLAHFAKPLQRVRLIEKSTARIFTPRVEHFKSGHPQRPADKWPRLIVLRKFPEQHNGHFLKKVFGLMEIRHSDLEIGRHDRVSFSPQPGELLVGFHKRVHANT